MNIRDSRMCVRGDAATLTLRGVTVSMLLLFERLEKTVLKAIYRISIALLFLFVFIPHSVEAQIAPTTTASISGSVSDATGKPVGNAKVSLSGPKSTSTQTDAQGLFVFIGLPFGTYSISAAATGLGTATRTGISVQGDTNVAIQYEPASANGLKVIANVSSRTNAEFNVTPASITQVNPITNAFEGKTSWRTILEQIPGVAQAGLLDGRLDSASFPDGPLVSVKISINGALPYETATLLDDMPLIGGGVLSGTAGTGTDLSLYPLNGFGAADVVRGPGASAPSIVDSIGGSFVLHPPGAVHVNHMTLSLSTDPYGGIVANALAAMHWKKLSAVVTYGVNDSPGPTNSATVPAFTYFSPNTVNGSSFSPYSPPCALPTCAYGSYLMNPNYAFASFPFYGYKNGLQVCCYQDSTAWSQHSGSIALNYEFSPSMSADIFYTGQNSQQALPYPEFTVDFSPSAGYTGSIPVGQQLFLGEGYLLAPTPLQQTSSLLEEKITARVGSGLLRLAALQNRTFASFVTSSPTSITQQLFGSGMLNGVLTVFNGGTYNVTYPVYDLNRAQNSNNRDLLFGYTTPLSENLRAGVSFVRSYYDTPYQDFCDIGGFLGSGFTPPAVSQTTNEFRVFIGDTPSAKTSLDLSAYFANADYHVQDPNDPTGNTYMDKRYSYVAPRLGFVWRPTAAVAIRASAGGGFAEAPLNDLVGSNAIYLCGPYYEEFKTNVDLQPEKSFGFDLGTDIRLHRDTVFSLDVYRTNLYGQLYNSTSTSTYLGLPLYTMQYGNLGESRYEGILLSLRHDTPHGAYWALSGGLTRGYVVSLPAGFYDNPSVPCTNCTNLYIVPNINFDSANYGSFGGVSIPYSQALGTLGYRWNSKKYIELVGTYYGNNNTYFRPAFVELDGHIDYPFSKNASLLVTFRNITGVYDGTTQIYSSGNISGVPTIAGPPYPRYGEEYGPRTIILTTNVSL